MFLIKKTEVCNFADNTTIYLCSLNYEVAHRKLSNDTHIVPNYNYGHNITRILDILSNFPFTTSEMKPDC